MRRRVSDIDWQVEQWGSGPDLVCLHGAGASAESWSRLAQVLNADWRVTAMDLPGHGGSSAFQRGEYTLTRTARGVAELIAALDIREPVVVGHSAGAAIGMVWALEGHAPAPRRLLAINPALLPFAGPAGFLFPALARVAASLPRLDTLIAGRARRTDEVDRLIASTGSIADPEIRARYRALMTQPAHVRSVLEMMAGWRLDGLVERWLRSGWPLAILLAERDRTVPPRRTRRALQGGSRVQLESVADAGHLVHEEQPQRVADWVRAMTRAPSKEYCHG